MLAHLLGAMLAYVDPSAATKPEKWKKWEEYKTPVKRGSFWRGEVVGSRGGGPSLLGKGEKRLRRCHGLSPARGGGPFLLRRGENCRTAMPRPGGPSPDLTAYA